MRLDKLTTQFQQALAEAQSLANASDHPYVEPLHVLHALLAPPDGPGRPRLEPPVARSPAPHAAAEHGLRPHATGGGRVGRRAGPVG